MYVRNRFNTQCYVCYTKEMCFLNEIDFTLLQIRNNNNMLQNTGLLQDTLVRQETYALHDTHVTQEARNIKGTRVVPPGTATAEHQNSKQQTADNVPSNTDFSIDEDRMSIEHREVSILKQKRVYPLFV